MTPNLTQNPIILGVIPARSGSKGILNKNIQSVNSVPMIEYTFRAADASKHLTRTILSTDSLLYSDYAKPYRVEAPFLRPPELAQDKTLILPVLQHLLTTLARTENFVPDIIVLLQPTSPLRTAQHIDEAIETMIQQQADTVVSVMEVPHQFTPGSLMKRDEQGILRPYQTGEIQLRRQDKPTLYARNGPAVLGITRETIENDTLYGERIAAYVMDTYHSLDVDTPLDLKIADFLLRDAIQP